MADNTVTLVGNLTRDPELRFTTGGRGVASFGLAVNRRYQSNGEWQEQTSFFNVVAWGTLGENAAASLHQGHPRHRLRPPRAALAGRPRTARSAPWSRSIADEIGPSLRWARPRSSGPRAPPRAAVPAAAAARGAGAGPSGGGAPARPVYGDEEPF